MSADFLPSLAKETPNFFGKIKAGEFTLDVTAYKSFLRTKQWWWSNNINGIRFGEACPVRSGSTSLRTCSWCLFRLASPFIWMPAWLYPLNFPRWPQRTLCQTKHVAPEADKTQVDKERKEQNKVYITCNMGLGWSVQSFYYFSCLERKQLVS